MPVQKVTDDYRERQLIHIDKLEKNQFSKLAFEYKPNGHKDTSRPLKYEGRTGMSLSCERE
jgi:hypothetical protein